MSRTTTPRKTIPKAPSIALLRATTHDENPAIVDRLATRSIEVQGDVPNGPYLRVRWERCEGESGADPNGYLLIGGHGGFEGESGADGRFLTKDTRVIRALAILLTNLAERVDADEFGGGVGQ